MAPVGAYNEFLGGLSLLLGLFTPLGALAIIGNMAVAIWKVHGKNGFFAQKQGWELPGIIIAATAALALGGPGNLSLDKAFLGGKKKNKYF